MKFLNNYLLILISIFVFSFTHNLKAQQAPSTFNTGVVQKPSIKTVELEVGGMTCQKGCADGIDKHLKTIKGVQKSKTKLSSGISKITYDESVIPVSGLIYLIEERGYTAKVRKD
ncbi:MAG: heavy-metal-associated domain-containing protein [Saprospiraceae bacterium]|nr:heavy-metal-associated domain-containing protein [Saprospiraceae bacterium]